MPIEYHQVPAFNHNGPCNCCGMLVHRDENELRAYWGDWYNKGITVLLSDELEESDDGKTVIDKVVTRQGTINTVIKYA